MTFKKKNDRPCECAVIEQPFGSANLTSKPSSLLHISSKNRKEPTLKRDNLYSAENLSHSSIVLISIWEFTSRYNKHSLYRQQCTIARMAIIFHSSSDFHDRFVSSGLAEHVHTSGDHVVQVLFIDASFQSVRNLLFL